MWKKGVGNLGAEKLTSIYRWGDDVERMVLLKENDEEREIKPDINTEPAVFFGLGVFGLSGRLLVKGFY